MKYVLLLTVVMIITGCNQQNVKTPKQQNPVVTEQTNESATQESKIIEEIENVTDVEPKPENQDMAVVDDTKEIEKTQDEPNIRIKTDDTTNTKTSTENFEDVKVPIIFEEKKAALTSLYGNVILNTDAMKNKDVEIKSTVIYFKPNGNYKKPLENKNHTISSQNKRFVPNVLAIQKGSSVTFPNMDRILHNVFSVSNIQKFDLGLYSAGNEKTVTFDNAGIIYVHCNVHHSMQADILVLDTPFYTSVDENGNFSLTDLPSKSGDLYFWHPRAKLEKIAINDASDIKSINKVIDIVRKKIPKHLNKLGAPYRPIRKK